MSKIVLEDFNEGNGYYKVNLAYLNKEQVEEIETLISTWKPTDEDIKSCIQMCLTDANEHRFKDYGTNLKDCLAWLEKQGQEKHLSEPIKDYQGSFTCWNNAHDFRPKHLQRCICYDKYMGGVYCYVYDDISKYWCTQTTEEHDSDGDNHICDYADYRITLWMPLPNTSFYHSKSRFDKQREQKSTWSEEDERNLKCIMKITKEKAFADYDIDEDNNILGIYGILENWMKSLKQRIEKQQ